MALTLTTSPARTEPVQDAALALWGFVVQDVQAQFFNKAAVRQATDNKFFRQHEFDWYGQDTWKARRNLTLSLGLRYQFNGVPFEENANVANLLTDPASSPTVFTIVGPGTGKSMYKPDYSDIEPRVGLSWDPWGDGKTSVRAAFGIFHDRVFGNLFGNVRGNCRPLNRITPPFRKKPSVMPSAVAAFPQFHPSRRRPLRFQTVRCCQTPRSSMFIPQSHRQ